MKRIPLSDANKMSNEDFRTLFFESKILALSSDKPVSLREFKDICMKIGELYKNVQGANFFVNNDAQVLRVSNSHENGKPIGLFSNFKLNWHNDFAHSPGDFHGTALYNFLNGGIVPIKFVDSEELLNHLTPDERSYLETKTGFHRISTGAYLEDLSPGVKRLARQRNFNFNGNFSTECIHTESTPRKIIFFHPFTGKPSIYLSPATFDEDLEKISIGKFVDLMERISFEVPFQENDIIMFDNLSVTHRRNRFDGERILHRIQFSYNEIQHEPKISI